MNNIEEKILSARLQKNEKLSSNGSVVTIIKEEKPNTISKSEMSIRSINNTFDKNRLKLNLNYLKQNYTGAKNSILNSNEMRTDT